MTDHSDILRVLSIPDIHFGKKDSKRLEKELDEIFWKFVENPEEKVDMISITGDLFDRALQLNEYVGSLVVKFVNRLVTFTHNNDIQLRIIKGTLSHDHNQLRAFSDLPYEYSNFKIIEKITDEEITIKGKDYRILYIPEEYPTNYEDFYKEYLYDKPDKYYDFILGHGMIDFVAFTDYTEEGENRVHGTPTHSSDDLIRISKGPLLFGHIHDLKEYKDQIYYSGSFSRYAFDSQEDKGFLVANIDLEDSSKFEMEFIENTLAPTYGVIDVDDIDVEDLKDKMEVIEMMKEKFDYVKIKTSSKSDLDIIRKISESDSSIKIQATNKTKEEIKVDEKYQFILRKEFSLPETIQKFISIDYSKDIPIEIIKEIITDKNLDLEEIIKMKNDNTKIKKVNVE